MSFATLKVEHDESNGDVLLDLHACASGATREEAMREMAQFIASAMREEGVNQETVSVMKSSGAVGRYEIPITDPLTRVLAINGVEFRNLSDEGGRPLRDSEGHRFFVQFN